MGSEKNQISWQEYKYAQEIRSKILILREAIHKLEASVDMAENLYAKLLENIDIDERWLTNQVSELDH